MRLPGSLSSDSAVKLIASANSDPCPPVRCGACPPGWRDCGSAGRRGPGSGGTRGSCPPGRRGPGSVGRRGTCPPGRRGPGSVGRRGPGSVGRRGPGSVGRCGRWVCGALSTWASSSVAEPCRLTSVSSSALRSSATRSSTAANRAAFEPKFWKITGSVTPTLAATSDTFPARYPAAVNTSVAAFRIDSRRCPALIRCRLARPPAFTLRMVTLLPSNLVLTKLAYNLVNTKVRRDMAFQRALHGHQRPQGATIERVRVHEAATSIAFMGRRRRVYTRIVAVSGAKPGDRVLDIGCSGGYLARLLAATVGPDGQVTGIDPAASAVRYANRRAPGYCSFRVGVAQDLGLPDESFDVVTSTLAVHHFPETMRAAAFGEMYRVTRPGGRLLVADFRPTGIMRGLHPTGNTASNTGQLAALVTAAGFHIEASGDLPKLGYVRARR